MKRLYLILPILLLLGCQTTSEEYISMDSVSERQQIQDAATCEMEGNKSRSMNGYGGLAGISYYYATYNEQFDACMRSKGYLKQKDKEKLEATQRASIEE